ncbi:hypothetical protein OJJOAM_001956 [Cupriavidus sp. H18C1]
MMRFAGRSPFGWAALDIKTLGFSLTGLRYRRTVKAALPQAWIDPLPHTHVALDDALEQGAMFCNMLAALREREAALAAIAPAADAAPAGPAGSPSSAEPTGTSAPPDDIAQQG